MSETATSALQATIPTTSIKFGPKFRHLYDPPDEKRIKQSTQAFRADPSYAAGIDVASNGSLLAGEEHVEGARRAKLKHVRITQHSSAVEPDHWKEALMIELGLARSGTSPMAVVRCLVRAHEILGEPDCQVLRSLQRTSDRTEQIRRHLGGSMREAQRYLKVHDSPRELQRAYDRREIDLKTASRVCKLPSEVRDTIAQAIASGTPARDAIAPHLPPTNKRHWSTMQEFDKLLRHNLERLGVFGEIEAIDEPDVKLLEQVITKLTHVREHAHVSTKQARQAARDKRVKEIQELLNRR
jgi:hypothetical protein